jgi:hypothetical protein
MNRRYSLLTAVAVGACLHLSPRAGTCADAGQYLISVSVRQGDAQGARQTGSLRVLAEPTLVAQVGQEARYSSGGVPTGQGAAVEPGNELRVLVEEVDHAVRLRLFLEHTVLLESTEDTARLRTDRVVCTKAVKPGHLLKFDWGRPSEHMWVELTVEKLGR